MKASQWPVDDAVLRALLDATGDAYYAIRTAPDVAVEFVSDAVLTILGRPGTDFAENPELLKETVDPGSLVAVQALLATPAGQTADLDIASRHLDGHVVWTHHRARARRRADGSVVLEGAARDITALRQALEDLRKSEDRYRLLAENTSDFVMRTTPDRIIEFVSSSVTRVLGWEPADMVGRPTADFLHPDDQTVSHDLSQRLNQGESIYVNARVRCADGGYRWMAQNVHPIRDGTGAVIARTSGWRDVTAEVEAREALEESQRALHFLATHDPLTGLVNRRELVTRLEELPAGSDATPPVTTLLIDLDNLKTINDTHGHVVGDRVLADVAQRIHDQVRSGDVVARIGGDEFVVLLAGARPHDAAMQVADRIHEAMSRPVRVGDVLVATSVSIGLAHAEAGDDVEGLLNHADDALYQAKRTGRARSEVSSRGIPPTRLWPDEHSR